MRRFLTEPRNLRRWVRAWGVSLGIWLALDLLIQTQNISYYHEKGMAIPWVRFVGDYIDSLVWAFFSPFILMAVSRFPISRQTWRRSAPIHVVLGLVLGLAWYPVLIEQRLALGVLFDESSLLWPGSWNMLLRILIEGLELYTQVAAIGHGMHFYREYRDRELSEARLREQLAEAQLHILRMQLHPHFLFNTLNTISALIHKDIRAADRMLALLGDLLRDSFEKLGAQEVALKQEIDFLERYLEIEKTRFQDRLVVETQIASETLDAQIPNLILQPLVENSIRHGISRRSGPGSIEVRSWVENGQLAVRVRDDGPGLPVDGQRPLRQGVGLSNTQERLRQLYGRRHGFDLENRPTGGLDVTLRIPFRSRSKDRDPLPLGGVS